MTEDQEMDVTVAICTWNRADQLRVTLEGMTKLRVPAGLSWELMIIDNKSTDSTKQVVESFNDRLPVRYVFEPRQGKSFALNNAIDQAKGEYIFWTDDDVTPDECWLAATYRGFQETNADLIYGIIKPQWESKAPAWYSDELFSGKFAILDHGKTSFEVLDASRPFYGANNAGRKDVLISLNGYREDLGPRPNGDGGGDEDTELFERAFAQNLKIVYEPRAIIWHMIGNERCKRGFQRRKAWRSKASYYRTLKLKSPPPLELFRLPRYLYRIALNDLWKFLVATTRRDISGQFHYELKLISFAGVFVQACTERKNGPLSLRDMPSMTHGA